MLNVIFSLHMKTPNYHLKYLNVTFDISMIKNIIGVEFQGHFFELR